MFKLDSNSFQSGYHISWQMWYLQALLFYDENHPMKGGQLRPEPVSTNERSCCITSHQLDDGTENNGLYLIQYLSLLFID